MPARASASSSAACAPRPSGCGVDMWYASDDSPWPSRRGARGAASMRSSSAKPAASPIEMPSRCTSNGRQACVETSSSEWNPNSTLSHSVSTPPTSAASTRPSRIRRSADAKTFADDEHAVESVSAGPAMPVASATNAVSECGVWISGRCRSAGKWPWSSRRYASSVEPMLAVEVPSTSATRVAPCLASEAATASSRPSCCRAIHARRLLRQSQCARSAGNALSSTPATRPIRHASGVAEKSLMLNPPRALRKASRCAARPRPSAEVALQAVMASGAMRSGTRRFHSLLACQYTWRPPRRVRGYTRGRGASAAHGSQGGNTMLHMRTRRFGWLLLLVPALVLLMGSRQVPLTDPAPIPVPASVSQAKVMQVIEQSLSARNWRIVKHVPGEIDAVYDPRDFSVTIAVHYSPQQIHINYVTSSKLKYEERNGVRYIHRNYESW